MPHKCRLLKLSNVTLTISLILELSILRERTRNCQLQRDPFHNRDQMKYFFVSMVSLSHLAAMAKLKTFFKTKWGQ